LNKILIYAILILCFSPNLSTFYAQSNPGSRQIALAHSDIALSDDVFSLFNNPSGLANIKNREIGIYYSPSPFGLKQLANGFLAYTEPTTLGSFNIGASVYGFDLYNENKLLIGYSFALDEKIAFGFVGHYNSVKIKGYGSSGTLNLSLGCLFKLYADLNIGFSLHNPVRNSKSKIELPLIYSLGISYILFKSSSLNLALEKEINYPISFRFGVEHNISKYFDLRLGIMNEPNIYGAGIGINYFIFSLNYSITSHPILNLTHQFDVIIHFK